MSLSNMGSNRLFNPILDVICPMSFYSLGRLFDSFESVAKQASDLLGKRKELSEQVNDLLANSRLACCELSG
jgi:hypothetical protein